MALYYDILYNHIGDPFDNDQISEYKRVQSASYGGTFLDITAPATPNYPVNTPTRYFVQLPVIPDLTALTSGRPMLVKDFTSGHVLTRVTASPGADEYRISPATSKRPHVIELSSGQAGHKIGYDYYGIGSILQAEYINNFNQEQSMKKQLLFKADYATWNNFIAGTSGSNTAGAGTFTLPTGYSSILEIELIGGGGGGGSGRAPMSGGGGGGGGAAPGGFLKFTYSYLSPVFYQVGNKGTGGPPESNPGAAGGNTWWESATKFVASGGAAGLGAVSGIGGVGGIGGALILHKVNGTYITQVAGGAVNTTGGLYYEGDKIWGSGGGGGNAGSPGGNRGGTSTAHSGGGGGGGDSPYSVGGVGGNGSEGGNGSPGGVGVGYGAAGAGGGGALAGSVSGGAGGDGTAGIIFIYGFRL